MLKVVRLPRVINICRISTISIACRIAIQATILPASRAAWVPVFGNTDVGLRDAGASLSRPSHRDKTTFSLFLADATEFIFRRSLGEIIHTDPAAIAPAVSGLSPVIIIVRMPILRRCAEPFLDSALDHVLQLNHAEGHHVGSDDERRRATAGDFLDCS